MKRPTIKQGLGHVTTPSRGMTIELLGSGFVQAGLFLTSAEFSSIQKLYGFTPEKGDTPEVVTMMQAGADRNAMRHASCDGLRMLAWLAKYVPAGEDPVKTLVQFAVSAGCDVDPEDIEWSTEEDECSPCTS